MAMTTKSDNDTIVLTGQCYCGLIRFSSTQQPLTVVYCHCDSCRRATGSPVAAFTGLDETAVTFTPNVGRSISINPGVTRTFCSSCGSSLIGRYDYIPGQVYISMGVIDQANDLVPTLHCHESERLSWLKINDNLERSNASVRTKLNNLLK